MALNNAPDVRVAVFDHAGTLLKLDASADFSKFDSRYETTPTGSGAAELKLGLYYEDVVARGYYTARNIVQIYTGDDTLKTAITSGATKLYVNATSLAAYNNTWEPDAPEIYLYDGSTLTMRIPVTGTGNDAGGNFLTVGAPISGGGNPATIPAYAPGTTIGRRRYAGQIIKRNRPNSRLPECTISCGSLTARLKEALGTFTITNAANVDIGAAIYAGINQFTARWPEFTISAGNFPTVGNIASGTWTDATVETFIRDCINQVTTGDAWSLYIGHDRVVRLIKLYTSSTNTYAYNVTLQQKVQSFEPLQFQSDDQDASALFNSFKVIGDTDPTTKQPVSGIYQDATSISTYGQIDAAAITNVGIKTQTQANALAQGVSNQFAVAKTNARFRVYIDEPGTGPLGLAQGDVVSGVSNITVGRFSAQGTSINDCPDSEILYGPDKNPSLWTKAGSATWRTGSANGQGGSNSIEVVGNGSALPASTVYSDVIDVVPGQQITFSCYVDATNVFAGGNAGIRLMDAALNLLASALQTAGVSGRVSSTFTVPVGASYSQVRLEFDPNGCTVSNAQVLRYSQPQVEHSATLSNYAVNNAAPNVYGLAISVVTTLVPGGDRYQDIQFSAIEPDWNAAMQERTNALAAALMKNTLTPVSVDQYCVSRDAFPSGGIPTSGLAVNPPTFLALFAPNTAVQTISSPTFTCLANKTNWAWLSANGTWTVNQTDAVVTGAILFGIFMTNGTSVIGQWPKAPVGVMRIGVGNINVAGNLPAPTTSGVPSASNAATPTSLAADVSVSCTVTNVPQDGSAYGLTYYYRTHGQTAWIPYDEQNLAGLPNPASTQTMPAMVLGQLQNGTTYDFGIGYVGLAGYGPVTQIIASFVANAIVVTTPYIIGTTSPTPTVTTVTTTPQTSANGLAAAMRLQFTLTNQPTDGSLSRISIWFRVNGATAWTFYDSRGVPGLPTPTASQAYDITLADLTNGQSYDFGVTYENAQGQDSATVGVIASNVAAAVINLPGTGLSGIPAGMTFSSSGSVTSYSAPNAGACSAVLSLTLAILTNGGTVSNWLASIQVLTAPTGTSNWTVNTEIPTSALGTFTPTVQLGAGQAYDVAVRLVSNNPSSVSAIQSAGITTTAQTIASSTLQKMPSALKLSGPTFSVGTPPTLSRTLTSGSQATFTLNWTITDFGTPQPGWLKHCVIYFRLGGTTYTDDGRVIPPTQLTFGSGTTSPTNNTIFSCPIGQTVEFGLAVVDLSGDQSQITWPSQWGGSAGSDPAGALIDTGDPGKGLNHTRNSGSVKTQINASGQLLSTQFPNGTMNTDGSVSNVHATLSNQAVPTTAGSTISIEALIAKGNTAQFSGVSLGGDSNSTSTNWYAIYLNSSGSAVLQYCAGGGSVVTLATIALTNDTNDHTFQLALNRTGVDVVEAYIDTTQLGPFTVSSGIPGLPSPSSGQVFTGGSSGKVRDFQMRNGSQTYTTIPPSVKKVAGSDGNVPNSTPMNAKVAAILPYTSDFMFHTSMDATVPNGSNSGTLSYWMDNGTASTNITVTLTDGTTKSVPYSGTSGSASGTVSVPSYWTGSAYAFRPVGFLCTYDYVAGTWQVVPTVNSVPTLAQVASAYADHKFAFIATQSTSCQVTPSTSSSSSMSGKGAAGGRALA